MRCVLPECKYALVLQKHFLAASAISTEALQVRYGAVLFHTQRDYDEEGGFHPIMVQNVIDLADLQSGHRCLDLCIGQVAVRARQQIGSTGTIVAVNFSRFMLDVAKAPVFQRHAGTE